MASPTHKPNGLCCAHHVEQTFMLMLEQPLFVRVHAFFLRVSLFMLSKVLNPESMMEVINKLEPSDQHTTFYTEKMEELALDYANGKLGDFFTIYRFSIPGDLRFTL